ncbi:hypothetical protein SUDANB140_02494 [Streptomyces sp. enrichment culture]
MRSEAGHRPGLPPRPGDHQLARISHPPVHQRRAPHRDDTSTAAPFADQRVPAWSRREQADRRPCRIGPLRDARSTVDGRRVTAPTCRARHAFAHLPGPVCLTWSAPSPGVILSMAGRGPARLWLHSVASGNGHPGVADMTQDDTSAHPEETVPAPFYCPAPHPASACQAEVTGAAYSPSTCAPSVFAPAGCPSSPRHRVRRSRCGACSPPTCRLGASPHRSSPPAAGPWASFLAPIAEVLSCLTV